MLWQGAFQTAAGGVGRLAQAWAVLSHSWIPWTFHLETAILVHLEGRELPPLQPQLPGRGESSSQSSRLLFSASHPPRSSGSWGTAWPGAVPSQWGALGGHLCTSVSQGCHDKLLQIEWLTITEMYSHGSGAQKSRCPQGCSFWRPWGRIHSPPLSQLPAVALRPLCPLPCRCITPIPAFVLTSPSSLCPCVLSFSVSSKDTLTGLWDHLIQDDLILNLTLITSAKTLIPNKVTFWGSGWTWILGGHYSTQYTTYIILPTWGWHALLGASKPLWGWLL